MYKYVLILFIATLSLNAGETKQMKKLTPEEQRVIMYKGTEAPFSGKYNDFSKKGTYTCKRCGASLYKSQDKFSSGCGWPSFDDEIKGAIKRVPDADGRRIEIVCANCDAHLGHVFEGEGLSAKNIRHCVNSISMDFVFDTTKKAYFAGGCFWGVEHFFQKQKGVISAVSGFMGGNTKNPTYKEVVYTNTAHVEVVEVSYDPLVVSYEELAKLFFEIHDPTQADGQGPDIGDQYLSVVFYNDEDEKKTTLKLVDILKTKGYKVVTALRKAEEFYEAEEYHQDYYDKNGKMPYCHVYKKKF